MEDIGFKVCMHEQHFHSVQSLARKGFESKQIVLTEMQTNIKSKH